MVGLGRYIIIEQIDKYIDRIKTHGQKDMRQLAALWVRAISFRRSICPILDAKVVKTLYTQVLTSNKFEKQYPDYGTNT